jgi:hypothetical protein
VGKVNGKTPVFHNFIGFLYLNRRFWAEIAGFWLEHHKKAAKNAGTAAV